ncbi:MAG: hypothetical protein WBP55_04045 [Solirubrobacterales bacterium]
MSSATKAPLGHKNLIRLFAVLAGLVLVAVVIAGCGGSSDSSSDDDASSTTTVESELQSKLTEVTGTCTDSAESISNSTLQSAAKAACEQLNTELAKDITSASDSAKGNLSDALSTMASDCKDKVSGLPAGQDIANSFCSSLSASSDAVSSSDE